MTPKASFHRILETRGRDRLAVLCGLAVVALFWGLATAVLAAAGDAGSVASTAIIVSGYSLMAALAAIASFRAQRRSAGLEARTWRAFALGLTSWSVGGVTYVIYLTTGGDPLNPAAWSQLGYLVAYPFWYRALWKLRQPVLASSRIRQLETLAVEFAAMVMLALVAGSLLWNAQWAASANIAQLIPAILDILLLATFYGAVRRSNWNADTALTWFGAAFATLALSDMLLTYAVSHGLFTVGALVCAGYVGAMTLVLIAAQRPLRVAEVQSRVRGTTGVVAVFGLTLSGLAILVAPSVLRIVAVIAGGFLAWRTFTMLHDRDDSDSDPLTGFLEARAFERHLEIVVQHSTDARSGVLVVIDLNGFGPWNARNGYTAGDVLIGKVAAAVESSSPGATAWGRLGADRFALTAVSQDARDDRLLAGRLQAVASATAAPLEARVAIVRLPSDAKSSAEALDASTEALSAAAESRRPVVAYDGGRLDGLIATPSGASFISRRERIQNILTSPESIAVHLQPIVHIDDRTIHGFEALSRFETEPRRGPDLWIAEATHVGLGIELEVACLGRAWARRGDVRHVSHLAINASPAAIMSDAFAAMFADTDLAGLVFEITEHERVADYPRLAARLEALRERGALVAVDDAGAGHASLNHLIELKPDYIKLDRKLVSGLDRDPSKLALVRNMLRLADDLGSLLIAEGIETPAELEALIELGVPLGQGYLFGRPTLSVDGHFDRLDAAATGLA